MAIHFSIVESFRNGRTLRDMLIGRTLRDMLIGSISDTFKDIYHFRPRWNYSAMTLVELWEENKQLQAEHSDHMEYEEAQDAIEEILREYEERTKSLPPTYLERVQDELEGIRTAI